MFTSKNLVPVILLCTSLILYGTASVSATSEPLLLTPYIQQGNIVTARQLSRVDDEDNIVPASYAGFITVDPVVRNHLFFWFFPVLSSNSTAPLLIWLNGGPGESSMFGLLLENGPIQLGKSDCGETIYTRRNNTWANKYSMLYIDNPVGVGYSYSANITVGERSTQDGYTSDLYEFIKQFYQMFPEFLERDLYIGGQSYAAKYVPALAYKVHQEIHTCESRIPLKGIYLGGPLIDPGVQLVELFDLYYNLGYISNKQLIEYKKNMTDKITFWKGEGIIGMLHPYTNGNFHKFEYNQFDVNEIETVMTSDKLRSLLHVGKTSFASRNYVIHFSVVKGDFMVSTATKLTELMNSYKVLVYGGDLDGLVSAPGIETILESLQWSWRSAYDLSLRVAWTYENGTVKGFYNRVSNFCRVVIRSAGHRTGIDKPDNTLEMLDQFVTHGCVS